VAWKDPEIKRVRHRDYMRRRYQSDPATRAKQLVRVKTKYAKDRPTVCTACGERPVEEAHHPDYQQPDLRVWLCRPCHLAFHK
jgi:hypothetical protein